MRRQTRGIRALLTDDGEVDALVTSRAVIEVHPAPVDPFIRRLQTPQPQHRWPAACVSVADKLRPRAAPAAVRKSPSTATVETGRQSTPRYTSAR